MELFKTGPGIIHIHFDRLTAIPALMMLDDRQRHIVVRQRDYRRNPGLMQGFKNLAIIGYARRVRLCIIAIRENARPADAHAEGLKTRLLHQFNVFRIAMIEIDRLMLGIMMNRVIGENIRNPFS